MPQVIKKMIITVKENNNVENLYNVKRIEPLLPNNKAIVSFSNSNSDIEIDMQKIVVIRE